MFTPLLGILASSISGSKAVTNDYFSIATVSVGSGGSSTITFSSIPGTYTHLQVRAFAKSDATTSTYGYCKIQFNSDTGSNYAFHVLKGENSAVYSQGYASQTSIQAIETPHSHSNYANIFSAGVFDILDYASTNKYKTTRDLSGVDTNSSTVDYGVGLRSGLWMSTSAITSITFTPTFGGFAQYSHFALYGIKS